MIDDYETYGRIARGTRTRVIAAICDAWRANVDAGKSSHMIGVDAGTVAELNRLARADRVTSGAVPDHGVRVADGKVVGVGDEVSPCSAAGRAWTPATAAPAAGNDVAASDNSSRLRSHDEARASASPQLAAGLTHAPGGISPSSLREARNWRDQRGDGTMANNAAVRLSPDLLGGLVKRWAAERRPGLSSSWPEVGAEPRTAHSLPQ